jgi:hypothetical protein
VAVRAPGDYDPNTGWPPDDSTGVDWQNDVELPGQFGPGGFRASPKLTAPASGPPPGLSLPTDNGGGTFDPRGGSAFRGPRWGGGPPPGFNMNDGAAAPTNAAGMGPHIDPTTGQPEMLTGPGGIAEKTAGGFNPLSLLGGGNPYWRGAIAGAGVMAPTPAETGEFNPAMITGRPDAPLPLHMPHRPVTPTPGATPASYPHMPWPDTGATPGVGSAAPAAAPAATRQRPNLGAYGSPPAAVANSPFTTFDRPNMSPQNSMQGRQGAPQMGMLDLSRLFGGGQPAPAPAPAPVAAAPPMGYAGARPDLAQRVPLAQTPLPPRKTVKSSSTSQGGGY